nr:DUF3916 domain-containing protein [Pantoea sp. 201603H]
MPAMLNLVQTKYSTTKTKAACSQALINACSNLITATVGMNYSLRNYRYCMSSKYVYK